MWTVIKTIFGLVVEPVAGYFEKRAKAKDATANVNAKIQLAQTTTEGKLELADHELAVLRTKNAGDGWKDEFVVILVSFPIIVGAIGSMMSVYDVSLGAKIQDSAKEIASIMTGETIDFAELWLMVVGACLGVRILRK